MRTRTLRRIPGVAALAVAFLLAATAAAQAPGGPFQVVATTGVGPQPGKVTYGYGAVWTLNANGSVSRLDTTTGQVRTTSVGPNVRDIRAGYNRIWVLRSTKTTATVVRLNTANASKVGDNITIALGTTVDVSGAVNGANTLGIGSSYVWVAGVRTWQKLASIDPSNAKVVVKSWPIPQAFTAAASALWMVTPNQQTLQKRSPSSLKILTSLGVGGATGGVAGALSLTYGADYLWLSQAAPNDLGQINKISPSSGLVKGAVSKGLNIGLNCTSAGAGAVWAAQTADSASAQPAFLIKLSQTTSPSSPARRCHPAPTPARSSASSPAVGSSGSRTASARCSRSSRSPPGRGRRGRPPSRTPSDGARRRRRTPRPEAGDDQRRRRRRHPHPRLPDRRRADRRQPPRAGARGLGARRDALPGAPADRVTVALVTAAAAGISTTTCLHSRRRSRGA